MSNIVVIGASIMDMLRLGLAETRANNSIKVVSIPGYAHGNFKKEQFLWDRIAKTVDNKTETAIIQLSGNSIFPGHKFQKNNSVHYHYSKNPTDPENILISIKVLIREVKRKAPQCQVLIIPPFLRRQEKTSCPQCLYFPNGAADLEKIGKFLSKRLEKVRQYTSL